MPRTKLLKIKSYDNITNTFNSTCNLKGKWLTEYFKNNNPITLELGAGTATFSNTLAKENRNKNYIAIDIKADRLYVGAMQAYTEKQQNIAFLQCRIQEIENYFSIGEVNDIWITFPDPYPKKSDEKHRLLNRQFLHKYKKILNKRAKIYVKTDSDILYDYIIEEVNSISGKIIFSTTSIHTVHSYPKDIYIKTVYEKKFLARGQTIKFICFSIS